MRRTFLPATLLAALFTLGCGETPTTLQGGFSDMAGRPSTPEVVLIRATSQVGVSADPMLNLFNCDIADEDRGAVGMRGGCFFVGTLGGSPGLQLQLQVVEIYPGSEAKQIFTLITNPAKFKHPDTNQELQGYLARLDPKDVPLKFYGNRKFSIEAAYGTANKKIALSGNVARQCVLESQAWDWVDAGTLGQKLYAGSNEAEIGDPARCIMHIYQRMAGGRGKLLFDMFVFDTGWNELGQNKITGRHMVTNLNITVTFDKRKKLTDPHSQL